MQSAQLVKTTLLVPNEKFEIQKFCSSLHPYQGEQFSQAEEIVPRLPMYTNLSYV